MILHFSFRGCWSKLNSKHWQNTWAIQCKAIQAIRTLLVEDFPRSFYISINSPYNVHTAFIYHPFESSRFQYAYHSLCVLSRMYIQWEQTLYIFHQRGLRNWNFSFRISLFITVSLQLFWNCIRQIQKCTECGKWL